MRKLEGNIVNGYDGRAFLIGVCPSHDSHNSREVASDNGHRTRTHTLRCRDNIVLLTRGILVKYILQVLWYRSSCKLGKLLAVGIDYIVLNRIGVSAGWIEEPIIALVVGDETSDCIMRVSS